MRYPLNARTRPRAHRDIDAAPDGYYFAPPVEPTRTLDQSAKLHAMLADVARQVKWPVNGQLERLSIDDWKAVIVASLMQEKRMAAGVRGGFVILGKRTSSMTIREMSECIEFLYSFGDEQGVVWSEPIEVPGWVR
ncbi:recombination protein NinB [Achromobacter denitrificans]|uniref:Recombination protein NinB n=1 Tax=Achromobacter denitrificans TaxID=32002 RepID=A0A6N0JI66_ACHDE|nr:recombination protein NinB [Achromobacter denitrificans]QKQ46805.1 recombination protein NinB [Achromobacter denitrificans]